MTHVDQCPQCRSKYDSLLQVHDDLSKLEYEKPSMRFAKNIYEIIIRKQKLEEKEVKWVKIIRIAIFFSVFLVFALSFYYLLPSSLTIEMNDSSLSAWYNWGLVIIMSTIALWLLYGLDQWYSMRK